MFQINKGKKDCLSLKITQISISALNAVRFLPGTKDNFINIPDYNFQ